MGKFDDIHEAVGYIEIEAVIWVGGGYMKL